MQGKRYKVQGTRFTVKGERMGKFEDLRVWQRAKDLAVFIYKITYQGQFNKDFGLRYQIRRAVVSVPSNISEGYELGTSKQSIRHFYIAKGSTAEVLTQAVISLEIEYITKEDYGHIVEECKTISGMLTMLIKARSKKI